MKVASTTTKSTALLQNKIQNAIIQAGYSYIITSERKHSPLKIKLISPTGLTTEHIIYVSTMALDNSNGNRYRSQKNKTLTAFELQRNAFTSVLAYNADYDFFGVYYGNNFPERLPIAKSFYYSSECIQRCQFEQITTAPLNKQMVGYVKPDALAYFLERVGSYLDNGYIYPVRKRRRDQGTNANAAPHRTMRLNRNRASSFSWDVQHAYANRCVVSGITGKDVHAAHIADVASDAGNDSVHNGILLHNSEHKKFDSGELVIMPDFTWYANPSKSKVLNFDVPRQPIALPEKSEHWPNPQFFIEKLKFLGFEFPDEVYVG